MGKRNEERAAHTNECAPFDGDHLCFVANGRMPTVVAAVRWHIGNGNATAPQHFPFGRFLLVERKTTIQSPPRLALPNSACKQEVDDIRAHTAQHSTARTHSPTRKRHHNNERTNEQKREKKNIQISPNFRVNRALCSYE